MPLKCYTRYDRYCFPGVYTRMTNCLFQEEIKQMNSKRDILYQERRVAESKLLRNKIVSEIRKGNLTLYNEKIRPARVQYPKT